MENLILYNQLTLEELEKIIAKGLNTFIEVGLALFEIKNRRLWADRYESFDQYCRVVWGFGQSNAYYLINNSQIAKTLSVPPAAPSHVAPLKTLKTDKARKQAWLEAITLYPDSLTASKVERIVRKYTFYEKKHWLTQPLQDGLMTVEQAEALDGQLKKLPPYYTTAVRLFEEGWRIAPLVLQKIRDIEFEWPDEAKEILLSGHLNGVPLTQLDLIELATYQRQLVGEKIATRVLEVKEKQARIVNPQSIILSGLDVPGLLDIPPDQPALVYIFPENIWTSKQVLDWLKNMKIFMVMAVNGPEPEIRFLGDTYVRLDQVKEIKPDPIMTMIKELNPR